MTIEEESTTYAYTPGLKVQTNTTVTKSRILPVAGEVLLKKGDVVNYDTIVATTSIPGIPFISRTSSILGVDPDEVEDFLTCKIGDTIKKGEVLAKYKGFLGFFSRVCESPTSGILQGISQITGCVTIREPDTVVDLDAYIPGIVTKVFPSQGGEIETNASYIQGIFGIGGEIHGELKISVDDRKSDLTAQDISEEDKGKILVGGSMITKEALYASQKFGVAGLIAGGIDDKELMDFLGYEIGVAITGQENIGLSLIITEGFGRIAMSERTFNLLKSCEGTMVSATGETQIRAGVIRPEIIICSGKKSTGVLTDEKLITGGIGRGTLVRIIREPYFGAIGKIIDLPVELQQIQSGSRVRVMEVELDEGDKVIVPRANVELIEE